LTREDFIQNLIVKCSDELLKELDSYEEECKLNLPNNLNLINSFSNEISLMKTELSKWETEIKHLVIDDDLWKNIQMQSEIYLARLPKKWRIEFLFANQTKLI
jgi:hypothetical protein